MTLNGGEAELREVVAAGDGEAFARIVADYEGMVFAVCRRILGEDQAAADASQETFIRLWRSSGSVRSSLGGWLHSAATSIALNQLRARQRRRGHELGAAEMQRGHADAAVAEALGQAELAAVVDACVHGLGREQRELIIGYFYEGRSLAELGAGLGLTRMAMKKRLDKTLAILRGRIARRAGAAAVTALMALPAGGLGAVELPAGLSDRLRQAATSVPCGGVGAAAGVPAAAQAPLLLGVGLAVAAAAAATGWWWQGAAAPDVPPAIRSEPPIAAGPPPAAADALPPEHDQPPVASGPLLLSTADRRLQLQIDPAVLAIPQGQLFPRNSASWPVEPRHAGCPIRQGPNACLAVADAADPELITRGLRTTPGPVSPGWAEFRLARSGQELQLDLDAREQALYLAPRVLASRSILLVSYQHRIEAGEGACLAWPVRLGQRVDGVEALRQGGWAHRRVPGFVPGRWQDVELRFVHPAAADDGQARRVEWTVSVDGQEVLREQAEVYGTVVSFALAGARVQLRRLRYAQSDPEAGESAF